MAPSADAVTPGIRGDVDGDGRGDIIHLYGPASGSLNIWMSKGNGAINGTPSVTAPILQHRLNWRFALSEPAVGDFNGDGMTDLAILYRTSTGGTNVWMFNGTPAGLADPVIAQRLVGFAFDNIKYSVGDVDGDGDDDLVIAYRVTGATNWWMLRGGATLSPPELMQSGAAPSWTEIKLPQWFGDTNNDGNADLAFWAKWLINGQLSVRQWVAFGDGNSLTAPVFYQDLRRYLFNTSVLTAGTFSGVTNPAGDRFADHAIMRSSPLGANAGIDHFWLWGGAPSGPFRSAWNGVLGGWDINRIRNTASDLNGDGVDELISFYRLGDGRTNLWMFYQTYSFTETAVQYLPHNWSATRPA